MPTDPMPAGAVGTARKRLPTAAEDLDGNRVACQALIDAVAAGAGRRSPG